jgi:hypothetical protein
MKWQKLEVINDPFEGHSVYGCIDDNDVVIGRVEKFEKENFYHWINHRKHTYGRVKNFQYAKKKASES